MNEFENVHIFRLFPRALRAAACFLAVCKIELDTVGESTLPLDVHAFPQIFVFLFCVCVCVCFISCVCHLRSRPCRHFNVHHLFHLSPSLPGLPLPQPPPPNFATANVDLTPSQEEEKQSLAEEVHPQMKIVHTGVMIWSETFKKTIWFAYRKSQCVCQVVKYLWLWHFSTQHK